MATLPELGELSLKARRLKLKYKKLLTQKAALILEVEQDQKALRKDLLRQLQQACELKGMTPEGLFRAADENYRQKVSINEFKYFARGCRLALEEGDLLALLTGIDSGMTGSITYEQWQRYLLRHSAGKEECRLDPEESTDAGDTPSAGGIGGGGIGGGGGGMAELAKLIGQERQRLPIHSLEKFISEEVRAGDQDHSGRMDYESFKKVMFKVCPKMTARECRSVFRQLDPLNTGYVHVTDVEAYLAQQARLAQ